MSRRWRLGSAARPPARTSHRKPPGRRPETKPGEPETIDPSLETPRRPAFPSTPGPVPGSEILPPLPAERLDQAAGADLVFELRFARYEIRQGERLVRTILADGRFCDGARDEACPQNIREAAAQGYAGPLAVWRSLVEHELLHNLVAEELFGRPSQVMQTESGGGFTPLWLRFEEEMLALALQRYFQAGEMPEPLGRYALNGLPSLWRRRFAPRLAALYTAAVLPSLS